ncbi:H/ACA ribonucleoprotein complex subunit GAR1-like [Ischnura elegans]|uniref:H/ACA ribonucleoprotein complex subunit GAR1-like n=1 Tax=Ischnura elegans TaxID=197161 RepID=UPI001ED89282|nr:H/ACA ribonucleoprotein complex subunit GAR1-like [Ischnura elegans]
MAIREARYFSVSFVASAVVFLLLALASAQDFGGFAQNGGPIQFPPAPMNFEMSSVVIGGSGFGFVPPRAGSGYNFGGYRGGSSFGSGGYRGSSGGSGYRGSASNNFGGFGGGYGGYGLRGSGGYRAPSFTPFGGFGLHYG